MNNSTMSCAQTLKRRTSL